MKDKWTFFYFHTWITLQISQDVSLFTTEKMAVGEKIAASEIRMYIEAIHQLKLCLEKIQQQVNKI